MAKSSKSQAQATQLIQQRVEVSFEYPVYFTRHALQPENETLLQAISAREPERRHRVFAVIDGGVAEAWPRLAGQLRRYCEHHSRQLELAGTPMVVPGGEQAKRSNALIWKLQSKMQELGIDRQSHVLVIGGGAVLDAVGYAAATTHRGVRIVRMPTTVLAQNDSGIGVKNGINAFGAKNFLGTFAPPFAVVNDSSFLQTLCPRDLRSGMAEAVKVALIRDSAFFDWMHAHRLELGRFEDPVMEPMIRRAAEIHMRHIATSGDAFEMGSARPLDFGHWAAHKLESMTDHRIRHGEAVAIGIALDCRYAVEVGMLPQECLERVCCLLEDLGFRLWDEALEEVDDAGDPRVLRGLQEFREHLGGQLTVTLLTGIGQACEVHAMDGMAVVRALDWMRHRDSERAPLATPQPS